VAAFVQAAVYVARWLVAAASEIGNLAELREGLTARLLDDAAGNGG
jgi:hypothetical protein